MQRKREGSGYIQQSGLVQVVSLSSPALQSHGRPFPLCGFSITQTSFSMPEPHVTEHLPVFSHLVLQFWSLEGGSVGEQKEEE